ncbi:DUF2127 domain-containing protein [Leifsonia sp. NPDC080035]|uniref:DUF2127 domain-containing protein n=1 Tax=Leifsonia sp. NPDC080035 TaxID=3143936 RepID=A0AAU7GA84_9MICO
MDRARILERTFRITVVLKGIDGVLELVGGILLLFLTPERLGLVVGFLTQHELDQDPDDPIANAVVRMSHHVTGSATLFGAVYLLLHGVVKVVLVWAVLRRRFWAYPWMIGFLLVFIGWQCWELTRHFGWGLVALTLFDILVVALTVREWRVQRRLREAERAETATEAERDAHPAE